MTEEPEFRNWRKLLLMLAAFLSVPAGIVAGVLLWPRWWLGVVGLAVAFVLITIEVEFEKPARPRQERFPGDGRF